LKLQACCSRPRAWTAGVWIAGVWTAGVWTAGVWIADVWAAGVWAARAGVARAGGAPCDGAEEACAVVCERQAARTLVTEESPGPTPRWINCHIWEFRARRALSTQLTSLCESFRHAACAASALGLGVPAFCAHELPVKPPPADSRPTAAAASHNPDHDPDIRRAAGLRAGDISISIPLRCVVRPRDRRRSRRECRCVRAPIATFRAPPEEPRWRSRVEPGAARSNAAGCRAASRPLSQRSNRRSAVDREFRCDPLRLAPRDRVRR
jgi:hypothetical protein